MHQTFSTVNEGTTVAGAVAGAVAAVATAYVVAAVLDDEDDGNVRQARMNGYE